MLQFQQIIFFFRRSTHKTQVEAISPKVFPSTCFQCPKVQAFWLCFYFWCFGWRIWQKPQPTSTLVLEAPDFILQVKTLTGSSCLWFFGDTRGEATSDVENDVKGPRRRKTLEKPPLQAWSLEGGHKEQRDTSTALRPWNGRSIWDKQKV